MITLLTTSSTGARRSSMPWVVAVLIVAASVWTTTVAVAGEEQIDVETVDPDYEFGLHDPGEAARLESPEQLRGRVDQRHRFDPLSAHTIGWPTGHIPPSGAVTVTNRLLYGQRLAVSVGDGAEVFAEGYLPLGSQTYLGGGTRFRVAEGRALDVTAGIQGRYRRTNFAPGTADGGLGLHAVFEAVADDDTTWNVGVATRIPVYQAVEEIDFDACENRRQWAESTCGTTQQRHTAMPRSGYWVSLFGGLNHFVTDWFIVNVEAFTGVSQGNFWALESALNPEMAYEDERRLVEETDFGAGLGPLGVFTLGLGSTWRLGGFGVQTSLYFTNYRGDARILPWVSAAYRFGSRQ